MENKVIARVEIRPDSFVLWFTDGSCFKFSWEPLDGDSVYTRHAVCRYQGKVLWTSRDKHQKGNP